MSKLIVLVDDPHVNPDFRRYKAGDVVEVVDYKSRLSADRWWHYKLRVHDKMETPEGQNLATTFYLTKDQVKKV